jgi:predicted DNA-binding transcriptional regulator AlpA
MIADCETPESTDSLRDVKAVASLLSCSTRHVHRLSDAGRMPQPVRLGASVRWSSKTINEWIADGCPATPKRQGGSR